MKTIVAFVNLLLIVSISFAQGNRKHINFDEGWKFHLGNAANPYLDFNYGIGNIFSKSGDISDVKALGVNYDDKTWDNVQLPHDWAVALPFKYVKNEDIDAHGYKPVGGLFPENSIGWYRKNFTLSSADSGGRYVLQFDGVYRDSKVWVNGYYVGGHQSGYTGASYDITDFIKFGKKNIIAVRVDATQSEGWFYEGAGIYRHVWLNKFSNIHIVEKGGVFVYTKQAGKNAAVTIETTVENKNIQPALASVYTVITDREGRVVAKSKAEPLALTVNESKTIKQTVTVVNPELWSLESPYLYRATAIVTAAGTTIDSVTTRFGIRTITIDVDKGLFLNGKSVKVQGVCNHQDHAGVGSALPDYLQYYRVGLLKEMGVNAYRTSHNPPTPELLDACDSLGMLVMDEARLLTSGEEYSNQLKDLLLRDRNHASIFIWSIGNEEHATQRTDIGKRIAQNQLSIIQQLDPTRTATYAANMGNVFTGVNEVIPVRGFNYNLSGLDNYRKDHPSQPIIGTEVASMVSTRGIYTKDTINCYVPDYDSTFPSWATTSEYWWKMAASRDWFMGGFAWTGFDYRGEPTPYAWPNINSHFGIMDMCGFPKTAYYYYQAWWTNKDVLQIAPHWNWKGDEGKPKLVWINSNADNVELFLNDKSLGKKEMPRNGHLTWLVNYEPGTLTAVAYKQGRKITTSVATTNQPYKIVLSAAKTTMVADNKDANVINVTVVDKDGKEVPNATNLIHFAIEASDASIIGVGNGNPSSHEPDKCADNTWQRQLFSGKAQVIIKAGNSANKIVFKATGSNLQPAEVVLAVELEKGK